MLDNLSHPKICVPQRLISRSYTESYRGLRLDSRLRGIRTRLNHIFWIVTIGRISVTWHRSFRLSNQKTINTFEQQKQKEYTRQDGIVLFIFVTMFAAPTLIQTALYHADKHTIKHTEKSSGTKWMGKKVIWSRSKQKVSLKSVVKDFSVLVMTLQVGISQNV